MVVSLLMDPYHTGPLLPDRMEALTHYLLISIRPASTHIVGDEVGFWWWSTAVFIAMMNANVDAYERKWRRATLFFVMLINITFSLVAQRYEVGPASTQIVEGAVIFWWWSPAVFITVINTHGDAYEKKMVSRHTLFYYVDKLFFFICRSTEKRKLASTHFVEDVVIFLCWSTAAFITMMNAMFWLVARWPIVNCC